MNLFRKQTWVNREIIDGWCFEQSFSDVICKELYESIFEEHPQLKKGGSIEYDFKIFDWDSKSTPENTSYQIIIERCKKEQLRFYEIIYQFRSK